MDEQKPPDTISDRDWKAIQRRAVKANPHLDSFADPRAVARRKLFLRQHERRSQS